LDGDADFLDGESFAYGYNWDWTEDSDSGLLTGKYLAGRYTVTSSESLQDLVDKVNAGTQSCVGVQLTSSGALMTAAQTGFVAVCVGDEAYFWGSAKLASAEINGSKDRTQVATAAAAPTAFTASALASAINHNSETKFWAMLATENSQGSTATMVYIFTKDGGDFNDLLACDVAGGPTRLPTGVPWHP
jgi:hypothetical protein